VPEPQRADTIIGFDPATGVVFYVRQNPWSKFDPLGLDDKEPGIVSRFFKQLGANLNPVPSLGGSSSDYNPYGSGTPAMQQMTFLQEMEPAVESIDPVCHGGDSPEAFANALTTYVAMAGAPMVKGLPSRPASSPKPTGGVISGVVEETPGSSALITKVKTEAEVAATKTPEVGDKVTRHWGGNSGPDGQSWTREPATAQTRENLGLGKSNTGEFVSEGTLVETTGVTSRRAKEWDGFSGGGDEVLVPDPQRQIKLSSVRMPDEPLPDN
jgi:hypothetical protein